MRRVTQAGKTTAKTAHNRDVMPTEPFRNCLIMLRWKGWNRGVPEWLGKIAWGDWNRLTKDRRVMLSCY